MENLKVVFTLIFLVISINSSYSQCVYEYWFAAPDPASQHGDSPIFINITNQEGSIAEVEMSLFTNGSNRSYSIPAFGHLSINLITGLANEDEDIPISDVENILNDNEVRDKGIYIRSDKKLSIYYEVRGGNVNPEIFTLKGDAALGTHFFVPSQNEFINADNNGSSREQVVIVATENNTTVRFTRPSAIINPGFPENENINDEAGIPISVNLNEGQTFQLTNNQITGSSSFSGLEITSNNNIAVTVSDCSIYGVAGATSGPYDLIGDQLIPVDKLGVSYLVPNGSQTGPSERVYVVATQDGTSVTFSSTTDVNTCNGAIIPEMSAGQQCMIDLSSCDDISITSNFPIYVYHISGTKSGTSQELGSAVIPPLNCTGLNNITITRNSVNNNNSFKIFIIRKIGTTVSSTPALPIGDWTTVESHEYRVVEANSLQIGTQITLSSADKFHAGVLNQVHVSSEYGFLSNFGSLDICTSAEICPGESIALDAGSEFNDYKWTDCLTGAILSTNQKFTASSPGDYCVTVECNGVQLSEIVTVAIKADCPSCCPGEELIVNGDFEEITTDIDSEFFLSESPSSIIPGQYGIVNGDEGSIISPTWASIQDPQTCSNMTGKFLIVNGENGGGVSPPELSNSIPSTKIIWEQTIDIEDWKGYKFCMKAKNLDQCGFNITPKITVQFSMPFGDISETITASSAPCEWQEISKHLNLWGYGNSLNIKIVLDQSEFGDGNDVAIDDISLVQLPQMEEEYAVFGYTPVPIGGGLWNVTVNSSIPLPDGCDGIWTIKTIGTELDADTGEEMEHEIYNASQWWTTTDYKNTTNFPGFDGTVMPTSVSDSSSPGVFDLNNFSYLITHGVYCDCQSWNQWTLGLNLSANGKYLEIVDIEKKRILQRIKIKKELRLNPSRH